MTEHQTNSMAIRPSSFGFSLISNFSSRQVSDSYVNLCADIWNGKIDKIVVVLSSNRWWMNKLIDWLISCYYRALLLLYSFLGKTACIRITLARSRFYGCMCMLVFLSDTLCKHYSFGRWKRKKHSSILHHIFAMSTCTSFLSSLYSDLHIEFKRRWWRISHTHVHRTLSRGFLCICECDKTHTNFYLFEKIRMKSN